MHNTTHIDYGHVIMKQCIALHVQMLIGKNLLIQIIPNIQNQKEKRKK